MLASAGGGDGGWMAQISSSSSSGTTQFEGARGFACRFLSDDSVIQQQLRRQGNSYYTTWTKWTPDGDLDFHKKAAGGSRIDTTQLNIFVDYDDNDKIHVRSSSTGISGTEINGIDANITSYSYDKHTGGQSPTGFAWAPVLSRIYHYSVPYGIMYGYRTTDGAASAKVTYVNVSGDNMGLDNGFMGSNTMGACWRENSGNNLIASKLLYDARPGQWKKRTVIGKASNDRQIVAPNIATTNYTQGASISSDYDLYAAGQNKAKGQTNWNYVVKYNNSNGSLAAAKIIEINASAGLTQSHTGARGMAVGSDGQAWIVMGENKDEFIIIHLSSNLTLIKALKFKRNGVGYNEDFSNWQSGGNYHGIDLNSDGSALAFTCYVLSPYGSFRTHVTFKIPSDLSITDGYYPFPMTTAGVTGFAGDGTNNLYSGDASVHITDVTSSVTVIDAAYTTNVDYSLSGSETSIGGVGSDTKTIGSDSLFLDYGPENL